MLPNMIAPAFFSRCTSTASCLATMPRRVGLPHSNRNPLTAIELLMLSGTPCNEPSSVLPTISSANLASESAASARNSINAFSLGLS